MMNDSRWDSQAFQARVGQQQEPWPLCDPANGAAAQPTLTGEICSCPFPIFCPNLPPGALVLFQEGSLGEWEKQKCPPCCSQTCPRQAGIPPLEGIDLSFSGSKAFGWSLTSKVSGNPSPTDTSLGEGKYLSQAEAWMSTQASPGHSLHIQ